MVSAIVKREHIREIEHEMDRRGAAAELLEKHDKAEMERHNKMLELVNCLEKQLYAGDFLAAMSTRRELETLIRADIDRDHWENRRHIYFYVDGRNRAAELERLQ